MSIKTSLSKCAFILLALSFSTLSASSLTPDEERAEQAFNASLAFLGQQLFSSDSKDVWEALKEASKKNTSNFKTAILIAKGGMKPEEVGESSPSKNAVKYEEIVDFIKDDLGFSQFTADVMPLHILNLIAPAFAEESSLYDRDDSYGFQDLFGKCVVLSIAKPLSDKSGKFKLRLKGTYEICGDIEIRKSGNGYRIVHLAVSESGKKYLFEKSLQGLSKIDDFMGHGLKDDNLDYQALLNLGTVKSIKETLESEKYKALFAEGAEESDIQTALEDLKKQKNITKILGVDSLDDITDLNWGKQKIESLTVPTMGYDEVIDLLLSVSKLVKTEKNPEGMHMFSYSIPFGEFQISHFLSSESLSSLALSPFENVTKKKGYEPQFAKRRTWGSHTPLTNMDIRFLPTGGYNPILQFEYPYGINRAAAIISFSLVKPIFAD